MKKFLKTVFTLGLIVVVCYIAFKVYNGELDLPIFNGSTNDQTNDTTDRVQDPKPNSHIHSFSAWKTTKPATCNSKGEQQRVCTCGDREIQSIDMLPHTEVVDDPIKPTCTENGLTQGIHCSVCNEVLVAQNIIGARHSWSYSYEKDEESHWNICSSCGEVGEKMQHSVGDDGFCSSCHLPMRATDGIVYMISNDGTYAEVIDYTGLAEIVIIAEEYQGVPVKVIEYAAFKEEIIEEVYIPNSVISIQEDAFYACENLVYVIFEENSQLKSIGKHAFTSCENLMYMRLGNYVESIDRWAFQYCSKMYSFVLGAESILTYLGESAFENCSNLKELVLGNYSITSIEYGTFKGCKSLKNFEISGRVTSIGNCAFEGCQGLTDIIIPLGCESIGFRTFAGCSGATSITIPNTVNHIGQQAFVSCEGITSIRIPNSVTIIDQNTFNGCSNLTTVDIPDSVTAIKMGAFERCDSLKIVYYRGSEEEWEDIKFGGWNEPIHGARKFYDYIPEDERI